MGKIAKEQRRSIRSGFRSWQVSTAAKLPRWAVETFGPAVHHTDMWLVDHGVFREFHLNLHRVTPELWRSAQPAPRHLRFLAQQGVEQVVNLRGSSPTGAYWLEQGACARHGLDLSDVKLRSRAAPTHAELLAARGAIAGVDRPTLVHCKSGADRTGLFCTLYLIIREHLPVDIAMRQLSLRFGHIRQSKTGIIDAFFDRYLEDTKSAPMPFVEWTERVYVPEELEQDFRNRRRPFGLG